ncbi:ZEB2 [Branchiostoma lanceolatum]|uniref:ZEB2 protein n=1 Tax=Branchiostoma lanceolatum TaxID=7740 RepID=A0A8J9WHF9_BRALA|nr:ZEB2 [Branchiostoma lanceolatum]
MQVKIKVEPNSDEYDHYSTGLLGGSSTEGLHTVSVTQKELPPDSGACQSAIPSAVGSSYWDSIQQLHRDTVNTDAPTSAAGGRVPANSQVLHSGQQCTPAAQVTRCPVCRIAYKDRRALTTHLKLQHPNHRDGTFQCKECNKTFGYKRNLLVHMKEQHLEAGQEFPCYECQKMYKTKRALKEHLRTHTNHKKYVCDMCGKCLKTMSGLKGHYVHIHNRYY